MRLFLFSGALFLLLSCQNDDNKNVRAVCRLDNPSLELAWLRDEINKRETNPTEDTKYCYIEQARFRGQDVFIYNDCNPAIDKILLVYNCEGNEIGFIGTDIPFEDLSDSCVIWRPKDFVCLIDFVCIDE